MAERVEIPEIKKLVGAMIFGANRPLSVKEIRDCIRGVADEVGGETKAFEDIKDRHILDALSELKRQLDGSNLGFALAEVAGGYRLQSDPACGLWLRHLLDRRQNNRLSRTSLETLSIIAYRQPVTRADIEGIRGVSVDHAVKSLMELQLVKIVGRSELPGRPFLYGTTQMFLEHFGLRDLDSLSDPSGELSRGAGFLSRSVAPDNPQEELPIEVAVAEEEDHGS